MYALKDKVAVVTGAGHGIGRALALALGARGCRLALCDIDAHALKETAGRLRADVYTEAFDVADRAAVFAFAGRVRQNFGTAHVVINNAGVSVAQTVADLEYRDFEWLMGINFWGVVHGTKAFLPQLLAQNEGAIVNLSSSFGLIAVPSQAAYNASKFAVRGFTEALRHELLGTAVKAICVHPGGIRTEIVQHGRIYTDHKGRHDKPLLVQEFARAARVTPERAATVIVKAVERGRERVLVGADAWFMDRIQRWMPVRYWSVLSWLFDRLTR